MEEWIRWAITGFIGLAIATIGGIWKLVSMLRASDEAIHGRIDEMALTLRGEIEELRDLRHTDRERFQERLDARVGAAEGRQDAFADRVLKVLDKVSNALARLEGRMQARGADEGEGR